MQNHNTYKWFIKYTGFTKDTSTMFMVCQKCNLLYMQKYYMYNGVVCKVVPSCEEIIMHEALY